MVIDIGVYMSDRDHLVQQAWGAKQAAYAPYSEFRVGAALLTESGEIYTGANIENINYTNTSHAEQNALHKAVLDGHRSFEAIAISLSGDPVPPCGLCRQSLSEFCDDDLVIIVDGLGQTTLGELLPGRMDNIEARGADTDV